MGKIQLLFILGVFLISTTIGHTASRSVSSSQAKITKITAVTLFTFIFQQRYNDAAYKRPGMKIFISAVDDKGKNVTSAATLQKFRRLGFNVFPIWKQSHLASHGAYNLCELSRPQMLSPTRMIWHCFRSRTNAEDSGIENSWKESTVWLHKIGNNWHIEKWKFGNGVS